MTYQDIINQRLYTQRLAYTNYTLPEDVVKYCGAIQAQDFFGAKWAIGLRTKICTTTSIDEAFNKGLILRTHVLRPTWHFVHPADIRWMLQLTAPRIKAMSIYYYHSLGLNDELLIRSRKIIGHTLQGGKEFTRVDLVSALQGGGIQTNNLGYIYLIMDAELEGIICSGTRQKKQFTYALLEEKVPRAKKYTREEALAEIALRYFTSHGPATMQDFAWWSGLTQEDAKKALQMNTTFLSHTEIESNVYWFSEKNYKAVDARTIYLLPNYDEYLIAYKDRSTVFDSSQIAHLDARANPLFQNTIIANGKIIGTWKRIVKKNFIDFMPTFFQPLSKSEQMRFTEATEHYEKFLEMSIKLAENKDE